MRRRICLLSIIAWFPAFSQLQSGPPLPHKLVADWAKLPKGWNFGECSGLAVDKDDSVWVVIAVSARLSNSTGTETSCSPGAMDSSSPFTPSRSIATAIPGSSTSSDTSCSSSTGKDACS